MVNSYLKQFAALYAMVYDSKRMAAYGKYQGYDVVIQDATQQAQYVIQMAVNGTTPYFVEQTAQFVQSLNFPFVNYAKYENLTITVSVKNKPRKIQEYFVEVLNVLVSYCRNAGLASCCKYCGTQAGIGAYSINRNVDMLCGNCFGKISQNLAQAQRTIREEKGSLLAGLVGAFLFSLAGVALWVIIGQFGWIAAIAGLIIVVWALKGFEKFGGKMNLAGAILVFVLSIVMVVLAETISESILMTQALYEEGFSITFFQVLGGFFSLLNLSEDLLAEYIKNVGIGIVFTVAASVSTLMNTYRNKNLKHELVKLN